MSRIDRNSKLPLYFQLKNILLERFGSNEYPVGTQIPTELDLMDEFNICRATVRTALSELESDGRIYKKRGVGTFVCQQRQRNALEPLMSLSYSLSSLGFQNSAAILENTLNYDKDRYIRIFKAEPTKTLRKIKRLRLVDEYVLGIEETYIQEEYYQKINDTNMQSFVKHILNTSHPTRVTQDVFYREATTNEKEILNLAEGDKVLELVKHLYNDEEESSVLSVRFIANARFMSMASNNNVEN